MLDEQQQQTAVEQAVYASQIDCSQTCSIDSLFLSLSPPPLIARSVDNNNRGNLGKNKQLEW
jgi:hypothetical protein